MNTLLVYFSNHHSNTAKLVKFLKENSDDKLEVLDLSREDTEDISIPSIELEKFDRVIFASGVYYGKVAKVIYEFARVYKEQLTGKKLSTIITAALETVDYVKDFEKELGVLGLKLDGKFQCRGYCTYGPLKLIGGFSKDHPNQDDFNKVLDFYKSL